jgi:hypothetical protein
MKVDAQMRCEAINIINLIKALTKNKLIHSFANPPPIPHGLPSSRPQTRPMHVVKRLAGGVVSDARLQVERVPAAGVLGPLLPSRWRGPDRRSAGGSATRSRRGPWGGSCSKAPSEPRLSSFTPSPPPYHTARNGLGRHGSRCRCSAVKHPHSAGRRILPGSSALC